jgi:hypothetical protein
MARGGRKAHRLVLEELGVDEGEAPHADGEAALITDS